MEDSLLLVADGLYLSSSPQLTTVTNPIFAIEQDRAARGLSCNHRITYISFEQMVDLTDANHPVITW